MPAGVAGGEDQRLADPALVAGMRASASAPKAEVTPGSTRNGTPARGERQRLVAAAAEDVGIAALQPQHPRAVARQRGSAAR